MTLIAILITLVLSRFLPGTVNHHGYDWFLKMTESIEKYLAGYRIWDSPMAVIIVLALPLSVLLFIEFVLCDFFSPLVFLFSVFILIVTINYDSYADDMEDLEDVYQSEDKEQIDAEFESLSGQKESLTELMSIIIKRAHTDIFAVLFWFILLGPFGALMFRLTEQLNLNRKDIHGNFSDNIQNLYHILTWPSSRFLVLSFAMMGNLNQVMKAWHHHGVVDDENETLLTSGALASIQYQEGQQSSTVLEEENWIQDIRSAVDRCLIFWMVLLALITLSGWIH